MGLNLLFPVDLETGRSGAVQYIFEQNGTKHFWDESSNHLLRNLDNQVKTRCWSDTQGKIEYIR